MPCQKQDRDMPFILEELANVRCFFYAVAN